MSFSFLYYQALFLSEVCGVRSLTGSGDLRPVRMAGGGCIRATQSLEPTAMTFESKIKKGRQPSFSYFTRKACSARGSFVGVAICLGCVPRPRWRRWLGGASAPAGPGGWK